MYLLCKGGKALPAVLHGTDVSGHGTFAETERVQHLNMKNDAMT